MRLIYKCDNCKFLNKLPYTAKDRGVLSQKKNLSFNCSCCNKIIEPDINNIKAVISNYSHHSFILAIIINIAIGTYLYYFSDFEIDSDNSNWQYYSIAIIFIIPFIIAKVIFDSDLKKVKLFNSYYV